MPPTATAPSQAITKVPVDPERLQRLQEMLQSLPVLQPEQAAELATDCAICLADYADDDRTAILLRCGHVFHKNCIEKWIVYRPDLPNYGGSVVSACIAFLFQHIAPSFF